MLYHFAKGTGLRGLHGIPLRRGAIIRPLLFATKAALSEYARASQLAFREDVSNLEDKYARNRIRHHVIPVFHQINPAFEQTAAANLERFRQAEYLYDYALDRIKGDIMEQDEDRLVIDIEKLLAHYQAAPTILYEMLKPCGFNAAQVGQVLESVGRQPGALFFSDDYQLLVDREAFIVIPRQIDPEAEAYYYISEGMEGIHLPDGQMRLQLKSGRPEGFPAGPNRVLLNADVLRYPLRLRHWRPGDYF